MTQIDYGRLNAIEAALGGRAAIQAAYEAQQTLTGGSGVSLGNYSTDFVEADVATPVSGDGSRVTAQVIVAAPPAWLDGAGNIIEPGLYAIGVAVRAGVAPTTPGLFGAVGTAFNTDGPFAWDGLTFFSALSLSDTQGLAEADLPYATSCFCQAPVDATGTLTVRAFVIRLAY